MPRHPTGQPLTQEPPRRNTPVAPAETTPRPVQEPGGGEGETKQGLPPTLPGPAPDLHGTEIQESASLPAAALAYASGGIPVFPVAPNRKVPLLPRAHPHGHPCRGACGRDGHGLYDATCDPEKIARWWRRWPHANIGVATGTPGPDVLDVDTRDDGNGYEALERLRRAGMLAGAIGIVRTPSGGLHLWYVGSDQGSRRWPRHHLDLKRRGGYVLAPPSTVNGRAYVWQDQRPWDQGRPLDAARIARLLDPPPRLDRPWRRQPHGAEAVTRLARWLARQPQGTRNNALYWAARRALEAAAEDLQPLVDAAVSAGLPLAEAARTAASAVRAHRGRCA